MNAFLKFLLIATISALFLSNAVVAKEASIRALTAKNTPVKAPTKAPVKVPVKAPTKAPIKVPIKAPTKAPVKAPTLPIVMKTLAPAKVGPP